MVANFEKPINFGFIDMPISTSAVEISFTVTVPAPVGIGIGELAFAAALPVAGLTAVTKELSEGTGSCLHWGAVADDAKGTGVAE